MAQLGKALTILLKEVKWEADIAEDLAAFHAPSECYKVAFRGQSGRNRQALRHACHVAGVRNKRLLRKAFRKVLGNDRWVYYRYGCVPY
jgi:hypothetical protein